MPSALAAAGFVASALVLATLPHHLRVKNFATLSIIAWLFLYNLIYGIDAVIWEGNVDIVAPVWCDIATKVIIGAETSIPGCCLCLARQLNRIAFSVAIPPPGWRDRALEFILCWGFPVLIMALHYIVQGHRFDLIEDLGCWPAVYYSWPAIIILVLPRLLPAVFGLFYSTLTFVNLYRRRLAFRFILETSESPLTLSQYLRLLVMVVFLGLYNVVLISVSTYEDYDGNLQPWENWASVHAQFSYIGQYLSSEFTPQARLHIDIFWWAVPFTNLVFFALFGVGEEAMGNYIACYRLRFSLSMSQTRRTPNRNCTEYPA
ncbi:GPCR fungal pheromone mating factor [Mycena maculata]|uniref:GPCR fungal pheromone mating factor n=1 Tax=Mycena maculata TaxID=230809 RepID=A0AAD7N440_9AGAR|nr:GPCR fungal pheromone mating factor [Mycena maculata]